MSIYAINTKFLNTNIYIYRNSNIINSVGDYDSTLTLIYDDIMAYLTPRTSEIEYELQGEIHRQTHNAYFNRIVDGIIREVQVGDIVIDKESGDKFTVIGVKDFQSARRSIENSHHIELALKATSGTLPNQQRFRTLSFKSKIS